MAEGGVGAGALSWTTSKKGNPQAVLDEHPYTRNHVSVLANHAQQLRHSGRGVDGGFISLQVFPNGEIRWKCCDNTCTTTIVTDAGKTRIVRGPSKAHTHSPKAQDIAKKEVRARIREQVTKNPCVQPVQLITSSVRPFFR